MSSTTWHHPHQQHPQDSRTAPARSQPDPLRLAMVAPPWFELPPRGYGGIEAMGAGLVDQLGGLSEAVVKAKELAKLPADQPVRFKRFPKPQSPWEALSEAFGVQTEAAKALVMIGGVMADPQAQAAVRRIESERMRAQGSVVLADQPLP